MREFLKKTNGLSKYQTYDCISLYIYVKALRYELQFHVNVAMNAPAAALIHAGAVGRVKFTKYFKFDSRSIAISKLHSCYLYIAIPCELNSSVLSEFFKISNALLNIL